jgi:hypothetical protein
MHASLPAPRKELEVKLSAGRRTLYSDNQGEWPFGAIGAGRMGSRDRGTGAGSEFG